MRSWKALTSFLSTNSIAKEDNMSKLFMKSSNSEQIHWFSAFSDLSFVAIFYWSIIDRKSYPLILPEDIPLHQYIAVYHILVPFLPALFLFHSFASQQFSHYPFHVYSFSHIFHLNFPILLIHLLFLFLRRQFFYEKLLVFFHRHLYRMSNFIIFSRKPRPS